LLLLALVAGCATPPADPVALAAFRANKDPLEPLNRKVFAFNEVLDRFIFRPIAKGYVKVVPTGGRDGIRNFLANLREPVVFANDALQGEGRRATVTAGRFVLNSTIGIVGVVDVAGRHGLAKQSGDFGQTLRTWGFPEGPYLMFPVWGPSNPRDAVGSGVDIYLDPMRYIARRYNYPSVMSGARAFVSGIDERSRNLDALDELKRESIDYYAAFRSLYRQHRAAEVERGVAPDGSSGDFYSDPGAPTEAGPSPGGPLAPSH
jgi:phospholipid-binding lipoprotein MlaA